jgi:hypothetical protein
MIGPILIGMLFGLLVCAGLVVIGGNPWLLIVAYSACGILGTTAAAILRGYRGETRRGANPSDTFRAWVPRKWSNGIDARLDVAPSTLNVNSASRANRASSHDLRS